MDTVEIGNSGARVVLSDFETVDEYRRTYRITVSDHGLRASRLVTDYADPESYEYPMNAPGFVDFAEGIASDYRGWDGVREWQPIQQDFAVTAESDRTGHATLRVLLYGEPFLGGWSAGVEIVLDVIERERLAKALAAFFGPRAA